MSDKLNYDETISLLKSEHGLIERYWEDYVTHKDLSFVVKPSIPIIWFGNLEAYCNSEVRVVTIGLNPSNGEFLEASGKNQTKVDNEAVSYSPRFRFNKAEDLVEKKELSPKDKDILIESYKNYFAPNNSYNWFNNFQKVFDYFPADVIKPVSYRTDNDKAKSRQANAAIHIDCKTALATDPIWGKLVEAYSSATSKRKVKKQNDSGKLKDILKFPNIIRKDLLIELKQMIAPDIILFSQAEEYLKDITNDSNMIGEPHKIEIRRNGTKYLKELKRKIYNDNGALLIYESFSGRNPFGLAEKGKETLISELIREHQIWRK